MNKLVFGLVILLGLSAQAAQNHKIQLETAYLSLESLRQADQAFMKISLPNIEMERTLGAPQLPVRSWLVKGTPEQIKVQVRVLENQNFSGKPYPVQEQECRCLNDRQRKFQYNSESYNSELAQVQIDFLGSHRGTPMSRVDVRLGKYSQQRNEFQIVTAAEVLISENNFEMHSEELRDYLIVTPPHLAPGVEAFAEYKRSRGYNVQIETVSAPANTTTAIQTLIKNAYTQSGTDFVILIGDEMTLPMFKVSTSGSGTTPSDLKYFTMDGPTDHIPDMYASRIPGTTTEQVQAQLAKAMEYEKMFSSATSNGLKKFIGIASNEGSNPSDDEYVKSIGDKFKEFIGAEVSHLAQNDKVNSNPAVLNSNFNDGAFWLTYLGHGSGTSWPSMNQQYTTSHIRQITNQTTAKPVIIDVACQNGRLANGRLGTSFMRVDGNGFGAAAYYGGTVDISWHPPAVMARGIAFEQMDKKFRHIGQALLAGQMYLAANWNNTNDVIDNLEWYVLQGDPGMELQF